MTKDIRINKYLSLCGLGARRKVEEFILTGKIKINGRIINSLSLTVNPENDLIEYNNQKVNIIKNYYYLILNKPRGYITTVKDEIERPTVMSFLPEKYKNKRINPVGRLDKESEGLLLFTNDGDMAYKLTHPKYGIKKDYLVELDRPLEIEDKISIEKGVYLYGEKTNPAKILINEKVKKKIRITITEGKKRHIRLTFKKFSYHVKRLKRISFGPIKLDNMPSGSIRHLNSNEINKLIQSVK